MNKLTKLYIDILESLGLNIDNLGIVGFNMPDDSIVPVGVDNKVLVVPTANVLQNPNWDEQVIFHPLSEDLMRGESMVFKKLRTLIAGRLHRMVSGMALDLMDLAVNTDLHKELSPKQSVFLSELPDADEKMAASLTKIISKSKSTNSTRLMNTYIKRKGIKGSNTYNRLCVFTSSLSDPEMGSDGTINDIKVRKTKDVPSIKALFEYILPDANDGAYTFGSNANVAPNLQCLLASYVAVCKQLNTIATLFETVGGRKKVPFLSKEEYYTPLDWADNLNDLSNMLALIPVLDGNIGDEEEVDASGTTPNTPTAPVNKPTTSKRVRSITETQQPQYQPPAYTQPVSRFQPVQPQYQPQVQRQPVQQQSMYPQMVNNHQPAQPQYQQQRQGFGNPVGRQPGHNGI